ILLLCRAAALSQFIGKASVSGGLPLGPAAQTPERQGRCRCAWAPARALAGVAPPVARGAGAVRVRLDRPWPVLHPSPAQDTTPGSCASCLGVRGEFLVKTGWRGGVTQEIHGKTARPAHQGGSHGSRASATSGPALARSRQSSRPFSSPA